MNYQWYPGHMTKARRMMQEDIKLIDLVIELLDARVPFSSRNPDIDKMGRDKARLILLNKSDLADEKSNEAWVAFSKRKGIASERSIPEVEQDLIHQCSVLEACHERSSETNAKESRTVRCGQWLSGFRMSENLRLSMPMPEKHVQRPEISRVLRRENSGSA